jgi:hypothetical protein
VLVVVALQSHFSIGRDADAAGPKVAIVRGSFYTSDFRDVFAAKGYDVTEIESYTAASLATFDRVVHYGNTFTDFVALESYVQSGGTLIEQPWFWWNHSPPASLSIFQGAGGITEYHEPYPGVTVHDAGHSLLSGVTFPPGAGGFDIGRLANSPFEPGVTQVASWADGSGFVGTKTYGAGTVIGINLHVITSDTAYQVIHAPWAMQLYANALGAIPEPATSVLLMAAAVAPLGVRRRPRTG